MPSADAERALHRNHAAVVPHHALHCGEAETRSLPHLLGREEGLEDPGEDIRLDAGPGVQDRETRVMARVGLTIDLSAAALQKIGRLLEHLRETAFRYFQRIQADRDASGTLPQRLARIDAGVHQDLVDLGAVAVDRALRQTGRVDADILGQQLPDRLDARLDHLHQLDRRPARFRQVAVGHDLTHQVPRAIARLHDLPQPPRRLRIGAVAIQDQRAIAEDAADDVVEVVRDTAGQLADRFHR